MSNYQQFSNPEEEAQAKRLEKRVESKIHKFLKDRNGDPGKRKINLGYIPSERIMTYLLEVLNRCSCTAKDLGEGMLEVGYTLHK
jgi:hypothetical protein